jgi:hypothetical protein
MNGPACAAVAHRSRVYPPVHGEFVSAQKWMPEHWCESVLGPRLPSISRRPSHPGALERPQIRWPLTARPIHTAPYPTDPPVGPFKGGSMAPESTLARHPDLPAPLHFCGIYEFAMHRLSKERPNGSFGPTIGSQPPLKGLVCSFPPRNPFHEDGLQQCLFHPLRLVILLFEGADMVVCRLQRFGYAGLFCLVWLRQRNTFQPSAASAAE